MWGRRHAGAVKAGLSVEKAGPLAGVSLKLAIGGNGLIGVKLGDRLLAGFLHGVFEARGFELSLGADDLRVGALGDFTRLCGGRRRIKRIRPDLLQLFDVLGADFPAGGHVRVADINVLSRFGLSRFLIGFLACFDALTLGFGIAQRGFVFLCGDPLIFGIAVCGGGAFSGGALVLKLAVVGAVGDATLSLPPVCGGRICSFLLARVRIA